MFSKDKTELIKFVKSGEVERLKLFDLSLVSSDIIKISNYKQIETFLEMGYNPNHLCIEYVEDLRIVKLFLKNGYKIDPSIDYDKIKEPERLLLFLDYINDDKDKIKFVNNLKRNLESSYSLDDYERNNISECYEILESTNLAYRSPFSSIIQFKSSEINKNFDEDYIEFLNISEFKVVHPEVKIPEDFGHVCKISYDILNPMLIKIHGYYDKEFK